MVLAGTLALAAAACDSSSHRAAKPPPNPARDVPSEAKPAMSTVDTKVSNATPALPTTLADASNRFGFDLYAHLDRRGNVALSPASITLALVMTYGGARGETQAEMKKVLHLSAGPEQAMARAGRLSSALTAAGRPFTLHIANRLFGEKSYPFQAAYLDQTAKLFGAPLEPMDFLHGAEPSRKKINGWIAQKTAQRIQGLIPPGGVDRETRLVLVNAIYFLANWLQPFEKSSTFPAPFTLASGEKKTVPMMHQTAAVRCAAVDGVTLGELPYRGGDVSMLFAIPDRSDGLPGLEAKLTARLLDQWLKALTMRRASIAIPKLDIEPAGAMELSGPLKALGMVEPLDRNKANFTGIANPPDASDRLFIGNVFHKAFVKVDEKGTEAAAATALVAPAGAAVSPERPFPIHADRPFLFVIRDRASGLVLFLGRVADPAQRA